MNFAEYIQQFKNGMGLSDRDIAKVLEIGPMTFDNYLTGYIPPSQQVLERLLSLLAPAPCDGDGSMVLPPEKLPFATVDLEELKLSVIGGKCYTLPITGDNLTGMRIFPKATAVIRPIDRPVDGDILLVEIDGRRCLRAFSDAEDGMLLYDDNEALPLTREDFAVRVKLLGRLTAIIS